MPEKTKRPALCESCAHFDYDEDYEEYVCTAGFDEDDMYRYLDSSHFECPYYRPYDEYKIAQKQ